MAVMEIIKPRPEQTPQCEAPITDKASQLYRQRRTPGNNQCLRQASYRLEGKCYCGQHAGVEAIRTLLRLPSAPGSTDVKA